MMAVMLTGSRIVQVALLALSAFTLLASVSYLYGHEKTVDMAQWLLKSQQQQPMANMTEIYMGLADRVESELLVALTAQEKLLKEQMDKTAKVLQEQKKGEQQHRVEEEQHQKELEELKKELQKQQANRIVNVASLQSEEQKKKQEEERKKKEEEQKKKKAEEQKKKMEEEKKKKEEEEKKKKQDAMNKIHDALKVDYHEDELRRETQLLKPYKFSEEDYVNGKLEPSGKKIVIVSACDSRFNKTQLAQVIANRDEYAKYHGYEHVFIDSTGYSVEGDKGNWNKVPAIREAFRRYKDAEWFWWLDVDAFIMNETIDLAEHVLHPKVLAERLTYDRPIMNVDYKFVTRYPSRKEIDVNNIDIILTHDNMAWNSGSVFFRRSAWTETFLEMWDDRKFRDAKFRQVEQSALTYLALGHPPFMYHFGQVPQRLMNGYHREHWEYLEGDLVVHFAGGAKHGKQFHRLWQQYYDSRIRVPTEYQIEPNYKREQEEQEKKKKEEEKKKAEENKKAEEKKTEAKKKTEEKKKAEEKKKGGTK
ncbi:hypothetical protein TRVA0_015S00782 [Trichomonascus vanleenenianus]|uniref:uncharacterized protein n=1 Tax=Trichomonascus vanleenenianus TaxID=2268995 RepID=UPI003ECA6CFF